MRGEKRKRKRRKRTRIRTVKGIENGIEREIAIETETDHHREDLAHHKKRLATLHFLTALTVVEGHQTKALTIDGIPIVVSEKGESIQFKIFLLVCLFEFS